MNDRFRFRAYWYNDVFNEWIVYENPEFITGDGTCRVFDNGEGGADEWRENIILCQCTGLKDKNGKLIYEGDIVDKGTRCKWIITWFKNRFILVPDFEYKNKKKCANDRECGFKYFENNHSYADKDDKVIGNIYKNKELLEQITC